MAVLDNVTVLSDEQRSAVAYEFWVWLRQNQNMVLLSFFWKKFRLKDLFWLFEKIIGPEVFA